MRLKVKKQLRGGHYFVSFECAGFNRKETKRIKKSGMPNLDLSAEGLGTLKLNEIDFSVKCKSSDEAEEMISSIKQGVKDELIEFLAKENNSIGERMTKTYKRRKMLIFGLACIFAVLLLSAYKGVISSQQLSIKQKQPFAPAHANGTKDTVNQVSDVALHLEDTQTSSPGGITSPKRNFNQHGTVHYGYNKVSREKTSFGFLPMVRPDFTLTAVPETLVRYSDWDSDVVGSGGKVSSENFKLILTPLGGFKGPVTLGISGSSPIFRSYLYPTQIEKLPGSSTLLISPVSKNPPQICSNIIIIARGKTQGGDLIIHEKKLVLAIRQKSSYQGAVWHVSTHGSDQSGDGGGGAPFRTIQRAIDCASAGDTVLVERGLYRENLNLKNKKGVLVASHFIFDQDESTKKSTIIEAKEPGWAITIGRSDQVTLRGFTIQKGQGKNGHYGGGIYCYNSSLNIVDNIITKNENNSGYGAGIYCYDSHPIILRNQITQNCNYDGHGAGIYCFKSNPEIQHNVISGNFSSGGGSGIHLMEAKSVRIIRNLLYGDSGSSAIVLYSTDTIGDFQVANNTISHNQADAIRYFGGRWSFENNIITFNEGYGLFTLDGIAYLSHNDIWGNGTGNQTMNYYGLGENTTNSNGNISEDPRFGNPPHGNFHLCFDSPCIDSGDPDDPVLSEENNRIDMGAFEYTHPDMVYGDVNRDGFIDYGDIDCLVNFLSGKVRVPKLYQTGDVNCDNEINKSDLSYLYRFFYYYGSEPCSTANKKLASFKHK